MAQLSSSSSSKPHIVLFPFMSKGHTIPLLHLANLLLHRDIAVTIFTTPANHPFISQSLTQTQDLSIVDLPFPQAIQGVPQGVESTDKLPCMALFVPFARATKLMQPLFEQELQKVHKEVTCIVSDGFLSWTLESASRFGIPRLSFSGMNYYAGAVCRDAAINGLMSLHEADDEPFSLIKFPWIQLTRNDFDHPLNKRDPGGPHMDFIIESVVATQNSYGVVVNTFYELEQLYAEYHKNECQQKTWSVGPLCLAKLQKRNIISEQERPIWINFLDSKLIEKVPVLYIAFGSQARISATQMREIALGLEEAKVDFLWAVKKSDFELVGDELKYNRERGMIVTEWVDQEHILEHESVGGFLSHCGWNSVLEGVCAGVPILAWPMMAEQCLNAKMVVEEIKVGVRVSTVDGSLKGFVKAESLKSAVTEVMEGEKGRRLREKAKEVAEAAMIATREGGSSWNALNNLIVETRREKETNSSKLS